jgi:hypothetical protein
VSPPWPSWRRDDVAAVWTIGASDGRPTMKFGDEPLGGKSSLPGRPVLRRRPDGSRRIAQSGEDLAGDTPIEPGPGWSEVVRWPRKTSPVSEATRSLVDRCTAERAANLARAWTEG